MMLIKKTKKILIIAAVTCMSACVSIPPEAPELSAELGNQIAKIEQSNLTLLQRYFDHKK